MAEHKKVEPGEYSSGTLRPEDLAEMFDTIGKLADCDTCAKHVYSLRKALESIETAENDEDFDGDCREEIDLISWIINEELWDHMADHAPKHHYFGNHPGDGASFGFWLNDEDEDLIRIGEIQDVWFLADRTQRVLLSILKAGCADLVSSTEFTQEQLADVLDRSQQRISQYCQEHWDARTASQDLNSFAYQSFNTWRQMRDGNREILDYLPPRDGGNKP